MAGRPSSGPSGRWDVVAVVAVGGALGSLARFGVAQGLPHEAGEPAWSTMAVNLSGALLLGVLVVLAAELWPSARYLRPFLGVGVLGGYTTFSTYMFDTRDLLDAGQAAVAAAYVLGTLAAGLLLAWVGMKAAGAVVGLGRTRRELGDEG